MRAILVLGISVWSSLANAAELTKNYAGAYFCKATAVTGLTYDPQQKQWRTANFDPAGEQYVVRIVDTGETGENTVRNYKYQYRVVRVTIKAFGSKGEPIACDNDSLPTAEGKYTDSLMLSSGFLRCSTVVQQFQFAFDNKRFQLTFTGGYLIAGEDETKSSAPYLAIGMCEKIE